jgi:phosphoglucosamine mutase
MPQILKNVHFDKSASNPLESEIVQNFIKEQERKLGENGRILVRKSGTENLIRIMVEGESQKLIEEIAEKIALEICSFSK